MIQHGTEPWPPAQLSSALPTKLTVCCFHYYLWIAYCVVVRKVSRGRRNPPSMGSTVQEWLTYVCATGEDDIYPSEDTPKRGDSFNSSNKKQSQGNRTRANSYRYEHDSEPVFGLPKFEVELETKHDMPMSYLASTWSRKKHSITSRALTRPSPHVVQCSLTSSFEDSLCVTMDVGLLFFLHDVVKSYIKENETSSGKIREWIKVDLVDFFVFDSRLISQIGVSRFAAW